MKDVYVGCNQFEAQLIKGKLEDSDIEACLLNEYVDNVLPYARGIDSMKLRVVVADEQYEKAREVLGTVTEDAVRTECPFCGSKDIVYGLKGPTRFWKVLLLVLSAGAGAGHIGCNYYCNACKEEF